MNFPYGISTRETSSSGAEERPWFLRSKGRLLSTLFLLLAIPTALLTVLIAFHVRNELKQGAIRQSQLAARLVATSVDEEFNSIRKFVEDFAHRSPVMES